MILFIHLTKHLHYVIEELFTNQWLGIENKLILKIIVFINR